MNEVRAGLYSSSSSSTRLEGSLRCAPLLFEQLGGVGIQRVVKGICDVGGLQGT